MTVPDNPCLTCPDTCCALKGHDGLRLSKEEFDAHFKNREQDLNVRVEDKITIISSKEGLLCPNLGDKGCRVYLERPIDCRLYPYQMLPVYETGRIVKFLLYMESACVEGKTFSIPEAEARALVHEFGKKVYGDKMIIVQVYRNEFLAKLGNKCASLWVKFCKKLGFEL